MTEQKFFKGQEFTDPNEVKSLLEPHQKGVVLFKQTPKSSWEFYGAGDDKHHLNCLEAGVKTLKKPHKIAIVTK